MYSNDKYFSVNDLSMFVFLKNDDDQYDEHFLFAGPKWDLTQETRDKLCIPIDKRHQLNYTISKQLPVDLRKVLRPFEFYDIFEGDEETLEYAKNRCIFHYNLHGKEEKKIMNMKNISNVIKWEYTEIGNNFHHLEETREFGQEEIEKYFQRFKFLRNV